LCNHLTQRRKKDGDGAVMTPAAREKNRRRREDYDGAGGSAIEDLTVDL
jgi:hypothetical protein